MRQGLTRKESVKLARRALSGFVKVAVGIGSITDYHIGMTQYLISHIRMKIRRANDFRFPVKFYLVAILFILFDIEIVFLYPWAVVFKELSMVAFVSITIFIGVLMAGLLYAVKKGVLEWK